MSADAYKQIYTFQKGDSAWVAAVKQTTGDLQLDWSDGEVTFSAGTGESGHQPLMVYLVLGTPEEPFDLVCSPDQPFLLPNGTLTRSQKLQPNDKLVDQNGNPVKVQLVSLGEYSGGVHHIAIGDDLNGSIDGHLILAGGVVAGDYDVQNNLDLLPPSLKSAEFAARPSIGTPEYERLLQGRVQQTTATVAFAATKATAEQPARLIRAGKFTAFRSALAAPMIPDGSQSLFTSDQAQDILANGSQVPISNPLAIQLFRTVKVQFVGLYPDITFAYDPLNLEPNLYSFSFYGRKYVLVSGGLARMLGFNYEGLAMAMAWGVACFDGGAPRNARGFSAIGEADLYAFGVISRNLWIGSPWMTYVQSAMDQWQTLLKLIDPAHAGGTPKDPLNNPSIACRWDAITSGFVGGSLPACAGGEPLPLLALEQVLAPSLTELDLTFSIQLTPDSATDAANYSLVPAAPITAASLDPTREFKVRLAATLAAGAAYELKVANLESYIGTGLDPAHSSAEFTAPKS